jgi:uncharacterized protein (TIGR03067 family)
MTIYMGTIMNKPLAFITLLAALVLGACGKSDIPVISDKDALQGTWIVKSETPAQGELKFNTIRFDGDKAITKPNGKDYPADFILDPSKNPKEIDLLFKDPTDKDVALHGIYELNGDTLRITITKPDDLGTIRPTSFNAPNSHNTTFELIRQKYGKSDTAGIADKDALQGIWIPKSLSLGTMPAQNISNKDIVIRFEGDKAISKTNGKDDPINFKLDPSTNPKEIYLLEIAPNGMDNFQHGIYELKGDTLRITMPDDHGAACPTSFNAPNTSTVEFTRQKQPFAAAIPTVR